MCARAVSERRRVADLQKHIWMLQVIQSRTVKNIVNQQPQRAGILRYLSGDGRGTRSRKCKRQIDSPWPWRRVGTLGNCSSLSRRPASVRYTTDGSCRLVSNGTRKSVPDGGPVTHNSLVTMRQGHYEPALIVGYCRANHSQGWNTEYCLMYQQWSYKEVIDT